MKILTVGNFGHGWDGSICDEEHIARELEMYGHEVVRLQREETREGSKYMGEHEACDVALIAQWDGYPDTLRERLRKSLKSESQSAVIYWAFDYQAGGQEWHERLIDQCDIYLSKRIADSKYPNWQWLSQDFSPIFLNRVETPVEQDIDVLFTGSYLPWAKERTEILQAVDKMFNLTVHSVTPDQWKEQGLKNVHGPVMDHDLPALIARSKVNLSIDHTIEAGYWSDRNAQIMACGGLVLFHYVPMSETVFRDKIVYFYDIDDCLRNIYLYVKTPGGRSMAHMLRDEAYEHAQKNLMVRNRVNDLLIIMGQLICE